jgi:hypothetical protein
MNNEHYLDQSCNGCVECTDDCGSKYPPKVSICLTIRPGAIESGFFKTFTSRKRRAVRNALLASYDRNLETVNRDGRSDGSLISWYIANFGEPAYEQFILDIEQDLGGL